MLLIAMALSGGGSLAQSAPALADHGCVCDPWPSFRQVAPSARRIVVGTVGENLWKPGKRTRSHWFRLDVDEVLRGPAPTVIEIESLSSGLPRSRSSDQSCDSNPTLRARIGDRLAIAYGGRVPGIHERVTTVAWVEGKRGANPGVEVLALRQVRGLAHEAPGGSTSERSFEVGPSAASLVTREIAPGVGRVSEAFTHHDLDEMRYLSIGPHGTTWAGSQTDIFRFDRPGSFSRSDGLPRRVRGVTTGPDGSVLVEGWGPIARH